ncbi:hypothetical protein BKA62DRAFT_706934, partial [Auriculariales sp. MPI-PUGE-AT-0066]
EIHLRLPTFEELMTHQNALNRKLEEFGPMNKEFGTVAELWKHFHEVISNSMPEPPTMYMHLLLLYEYLYFRLSAY